MKKKELLYNKAVLGGLTLGEVFKLVYKDIYCIEVNGFTRTLYGYEDGELTIWADENDDQPDVFDADTVVTITKDGIKFEDVELVFKRCESINVLDKIRENK